MEKKSNRKVFTIDTPGVDSNNHDFRRERCDHNFKDIRPHQTNNHVKCTKCGTQRNIPK